MLIPFLRFPAFRFVAAAAAVLLLAAGAALAWGPHSEITRAALNAMGKDDALLRRLGPHGDRLTNYCWMGDNRRTYQTGPAGDFYADDYLLFPGLPKHTDHLCPEVMKTYGPHFRRAVQALRTETPANASRWIGSLLHFLEDTGSPPHAAEIRGDVHSKMENWLDAKKIDLGDYKPRLLGKTEDEALAGFQERMNGLIAFSRQRGLACKPLVEAGKRAEVEPPVLECALETSRVVADLLHTLGQIALDPVKDGAGLTGTVTASPVPGLEKLPAKIVLMGTKFSTLADAAGKYEFHNLPAGEYRIVALLPGHEPAEGAVAIAAGAAGVLDLSPKPEAVAGNLLRNGGFRLSWVRADGPDAWYGVKGGWEGELIPVKAGERLRLEAKWADGPDAPKSAAPGEIVLRWRNDAHSPPKEEPALQPGDASRTVTVPDKFRFTQIFLRAADAPKSHWRSVALVREK